MANKQMQMAMAAYKRSNARELWEVYDRHSREKQRALDYCKELAYQLGGLDAMASGRIISHNKFQFSYGFIFPDPETGVMKFAYITRDHNRFCDFI